MAFPSSSSTSMTPDERHLADVRQTTNFRSVTRNDPSVQEIMETSVYSVIYHYEEAAGQWEKQKQEGPLFVVRRDKAPEYALYMLNRLAVKNVTVPLVPGEMKMTVVDASTLQVARRGEKIRRGIWFSEGEEVVKRFRETVLSICGEPSKRPPSTGLEGNEMSMSPAVGSAVPAPAVVAAPTPPTDGLSRLFAGLTTATSGTASPTSTPQPSARSPAPPRDTYSASPAAQHRPPPAPLAPTYHTSAQQSPLPVSQPVSQLPTATIPPPTTSPMSAPFPQAPAFAPGQTVDDLLMSILGVASPPPSTNATPANPPAHTSQPMMQNPSGPAVPQLQTISHPPVANPPVPTSQAVPGPLSHVQPPPPPPPNPVTSARVGNASFAQAAGGTSPVPATPFPNLMANLEAEFGGRNGQPPNSAPSAAAPNAPNGVKHSQSPLNVPNGHANGPQAPSAGPRQLAGQGHPMVEAVAQAAEAQMHEGGIRRPGPNDANEVGKRMFVQDLLQLIHTDPRFVEDVWRGFLERTGAGPRRQAVSAWYLE